MDNWFVNKTEFKNKLVNSIMSELEFLIDNTADKTANSFIDGTHNVFAFINDNGNDDAWIEIHYELYDFKGEAIGDLLVLCTEDTSREELLKQVQTIVDYYTEG